MVRLLPVLSLAIAAQSEALASPARAAKMLQVHVPTHLMQRNCAAASLNVLLQLLTAAEAESPPAFAAQMQVPTHVMQCH